MRSDQATVEAVGVVAGQARGIPVQCKVSGVGIAEERVGGEVAANTVLIGDRPDPVPSIVSVDIATAKRCFPRLEPYTV